MERPKNVSEHLANERTYLAWLRTSFSLLTLGFATSKFGQFLIEMRMRSEQTAPGSLHLGSNRFGIGMTMLGTAMIVFSSWHYQHVRRQIETGDYQASPRLIRVVSAISIVFGLTAVVLILQT